uniref:C-type lectin domain-containing protein n=1 Tax=Oreochromis aureus TaxID=47969 RepID=A0A668VIY0_OREAU
TGRIFTCILLLLSLSGTFSKYNINTFFYYRAIVVEEEKTWEEALVYCREHHDDLASVASETEMLLIQRELKKHNTTELGWIGLRFLPGDWLWVDGQEMEYEAWGERGKPTCPHPKMKCAVAKVLFFFFFLEVQKRVKKYSGKR